MEQARRFIDKHVIITGAGGGIGEGIARRFAAEGAKVAVADINSEKGARVAAELAAAGAKALFIHMDVTSEDSIKDGIQKAVSAFGPIQVAVSNAGISETESSALEISSEQWDRVYAINTKGSFMFSRACGLNMMDNDVKGSIVTVSSIMGRSAKNMTGAYASSKSAVIMFTRTLAKALAPMGIRVNNLAPGMVATDLYRPVEHEMMMEKDSFVPWIIEQCIASGNLLIPRIGQPEDMAAAVAFLASEEASYITAQSLSVDGGMDWSW